MQSKLTDRNIDVKNITKAVVKELGLLAAQQDGSLTLINKLQAMSSDGLEHLDSREAVMQLTHAVGNLSFDTLGNRVSERMIAPVAIWLLRLCSANSIRFENVLKVTRDCLGSKKVST